MNKIINSPALIMKPLIRFYSLLVIFSIVLSSNINAQTLERHQVITAYIYNFANNIQWQNQAAINEFKILIIGEDNDVFNEMKTLSNTKTLRGKPIHIVSKLSVGNFDGVHLIYITKDQENSITELFDKIEGKNILLISDDFQDKRLVMINFIESEKETLRFEINKANIINQNLRFTDDLVLFGGTEIDVAALYREGQQSLRSLQKHVDNLENNLVRLEQTITSKTKEIQVQKDNIDRQMLKMLAQNDSLSTQTLKIQEQQKTLSNESQLLEEKKADLRTQTRKIKAQQNILNELNLESVKLQGDLKKGNELLEDQKQKISAQAKNLEEKTGTINRQQNILYLLVIIIILVIILVFLVYYGYKSKQKSNRVLESKVEERTSELRNANEKLLNELSERKLAEEALKESEFKIKKLNENLELIVKERTTQLEAANKKLVFQNDEKEKRAVELVFANKELEAFSYSVSHDLRAPLRHINAYVDILNSSFQTSLPEKRIHYLNIIAKSAQQMGILIDDLLEFSRTGRTEMKRSKIDMNTLFQEVLKRIKEESVNRKLEWTTSVLPTVYGDDSLLKLVWYNLLSNAVKFTQNKETARIEIGFQEEAYEYVFFISDNGAGFEMQYASKLFGVFERLHSFEEFEGTGIGLAIVRRIIERHGGRTWAKAELDKGATFYFTLKK